MACDASHQTSWFERRPSSWPVRNERRHCAMAKFNAEVLSQLADIASRLQRIEDNLSSPQLTPPPGLNDANAILYQDRGNSLVDMDNRLSRMEMLLLRTPLPDFKELDRELKVFVHEAKVEPEREGSPSIGSTPRIGSCNSSHGALDDSRDSSTLTSFNNNRLCCNITEMQAEEYFGIVTFDVGTQCDEDVGFDISDAPAEQESTHCHWRINAETKVLQEVRSICGRYILQIGERYKFMGFQEGAAELEYSYDEMKVVLRINTHDLRHFEVLDS